jgi:hypothetical protein
MAVSNVAPKAILHICVLFSIKKFQNDRSQMFFTHSYDSTQLMFENHHIQISSSTIAHNWKLS